MANLDLALQFDGQYDPAVSAELQQLIAAIQQWANGFQGIGIWSDVPFSAAQFSANSTGSITPHANRPYVFQYVLIGDMLLIEAAGHVTVNNGTTTEIRLMIPAGFVARHYDDPNDENQVAGSGNWNGGGTAGLAAAFLNAKGNYISMQRWDGIGAAGYPAADCGFRAFIAVRVNPRT